MTNQQTMMIRSNNENYFLVSTMDVELIKVHYNDEKLATIMNNKANTRLNQFSIAKSVYSIIRKMSRKCPAQENFPAR